MKGDGDDSIGWEWWEGGCSEVVMVSGGEGSKKWWQSVQEIVVCGYRG